MLFDAPDDGGGANAGSDEGSVHRSRSGARAVAGRRAAT
jgi:hypothetical protein